MEVVDEYEMIQKGLKPLTIRWIDQLKQDGRYRSRLVAREIKKLKRAHERLEAHEVFSSMPPVESLKMLISIMMTEKVDDANEPLCLCIWDISRAHFYGKSRRTTYINLPDEWKTPGKIGRLRCTMYGTQDAANVWGETWPLVLQKHNIRVGKANRALFSGEGVRGFCHGDDFVVLASRQKLLTFGKMLKKEYDVREGEVVGFGPGLAKHMGVLHRDVHINDELNRVEVEADKKHAEIVVKELGLQKAKAVSTPRVKLSVEQTEAREQTPLLDAERATLYRSCAMRCKYLDQDRLDIAECVKALSQHMSVPREGHLVELKRLGRYLLGQPTHRTVYEPQEIADAKTNVWTDSDWAGEPVSRKSTSGIIVARGKHILRHLSTLQSIQALSSAEAEYYALTKGSAYGLGMEAYFVDLGIKAPVVVHTDSSSGKAFSERRGLGRLRHVQTRYLWLQDRIAMGHLKLLKVSGLVNPADVLTKALPAPKAQEYCRQFGQIAFTS